MNIKTANSIISMIEKECCRNSLEELCEWWDVTVQDYEEFMELALEAVKAQENGAEE